MTLIEILVVLAILGLMIAAASSTVGTAGQAEVVRTTNQLANTLRFAFDKARVSGTHMRVLIDIEHRRFSLQQADEAMYLPATNREGEILEIEEVDIEDRESRDKRAAERYNQSLQSQVLSSDGEGAEANDLEFDPYAAQAQEVPRRRPPLFESFEDEGSLEDLGKVVELPEDVEVLAVRTESDPEPITKGEATLYFFPTGRTQLAYIQLRDRSDEDGDTFTIQIQPLTGKVTIEEGLGEMEFPSDLLKRRGDQGKEAQRRRM